MVHLSHHRDRPRRRPHGERGAALVEFALVAGLLFAILFGIVDFGHAYTRSLDVRHGAREGSRLLAVNYRPPNSNVTGDGQSTEIASEVCRRMDGGEGATVAIRLEGGPEVGGSASITVTRPLASLSGLYSGLLDGKTLRSEVRTRLEVTATWTSTSAVCAP